MELISNKHISSISRMKCRYVGDKYMHFMTANIELTFLFGVQIGLDLQNFGEVFGIDLHNLGMLGCLENKRHRGHGWAEQCYGYVEADLS
jgi:hypothetical protein